MPSTQQKSTGKVRIIGGEWRGRKLTILDKPGLRPTADRIRETLFNWLQWQITGSRCLDLFAGTGALGIEAYSRGARVVWLIEQDIEITNHLTTQLASFPPHPIQVIRHDARHLLAHTPPPHPFDLVFLDPPFAMPLLEPCCELLEKYGWLSDNALIYLESARDATITLPSHWHITRTQLAGQVKYQLAMKN